VAFDNPENLEKKLLSPNEIAVTTDASTDELSQIISQVGHITQVSTEPANGPWTTAHIKTDQDDIYALSRSIFLAFAASQRVILEMSLEKGQPGGHLYRAFGSQA